MAAAARLTLQGRAEQQTPAPAPRLHRKIPAGSGTPRQQCRRQQRATRCVVQRAMCPKPAAVGRAARCWRAKAGVTWRGAHRLLPMRVQHRAAAGAAWPHGWRRRPGAGPGPSRHSPPAIHGTCRRPVRIGPYAADAEDARLACGLRQPFSSISPQRLGARHQRTPER